MKATPRDVDAAKLDTEVPVIAGSKAKEAVAGMLAQTKFMACQHLGTDLVKFNPGMRDFGDLWPLLKGSIRTEESPGEIHLEFVVPNGNITPLRFQANRCLISDADVSNFIYHISGKLGSRPAESPEELFVETMRLLDDEGCWKRVKTIAMALVNEGHGRRMDEAEVMRLLVS